MHEDAKRLCALTSVPLLDAVGFGLDFTVRLRGIRDFLDLMCGIGGVFFRNQDRHLGDVLGQMNSAVAHRGPDADGFFVEERGRFGMAHRRLAILDLSERGRQPMSYQGRYWICYNGEVYNYRELRLELQSAGYGFETETDTEVILGAYAQWGKECVHRFNGMWAFALYDSQSQTVFCSRDRFGIKPFYYCSISNGFAFGSEIKQLLPILGKRFLQRDAIYDYLVSGFLDHGEGTCFEGIEKLAGGHNLILDLASGEYRIERYYQIPHCEFVSEGGLEQAIESLRGLLDSSIQLRLRSDVRVGTCLSGGVDSSTVAGLAALLYNAKAGSRFCAIHARGEDPRSDESKYAKLVSEHCDLDLRVVTPAYEDFRSSVDKVVYHQEEPFAGGSIFMQYFVMQKAREIGCKVMLDGQGGDEVFLGYEKYFPAAYVAHLKKSPWRGIQEIVASTRNHNTMNAGTIAKYTIGGFFGRARSQYYHRRMPFLRKGMRHPVRVLEEISKTYWDPFAMQRMEMERTNLPILLRYEDRDSMAHSVEARLPFLDYRVVEFALNLDTVWKIRGGWTKYILRRAAEDVLPKEIIWRKDKFGFNSPQRLWMRRHREVAKQEVAGSRILARFLDKSVVLGGFDSLDVNTQWRLYNLAVWERVFEVEDPGALD